MSLRMPREEVEQSSASSEQCREEVGVAWDLVDALVVMRSGRR